MQKPLEISKKTLIYIFIFGLLIWFGSLDLRRLVKPDEGRYAEISREMALSGDWVTPRLNGIKYFEKPPMQYWATAAAFKLFGLNEWTARLWTALAGFLSILLTYWAGCKLYSQAIGLYAALILVSSIYFVGLAHINTLDMGLVLFTTLTLLSFCLAQSSRSSDKEQKRYMLMVWAGMAGAVLSKGLIGIVIPGMTLLLYGLARWDWSIWRRLHIIPGLITFLAIAAPWFIAVSMANPEFAWFFFIHEHFLRYATPIARREAPVYYFVPILIMGLLPWTIPALESLVKHIQVCFKPKENPLTLILIIWNIFTFAFFSVSSSKLPAYILPILPALALLVAKTIVELTIQQLRIRLIATGIGMVISLLVILYMAYRIYTPEDAPLQHAYSDWILAALVILLIGIVSSLWWIKKNCRMRAIVTFAIAGCLASHIILVGHNIFAFKNSAYELVEKIRPELKPDIPFYSVKMYDQTLPFYLNRTVTLVDYWDEFSYGLKQEPEKAIATMETFNKVWLQHREALAIMQTELYRELATSSKLPMQLIFNDGNRAVVKKPLE